MAVQETSIAIIFVASSLAFFGFKIHGDAINFDIKYRNELDQIKKKLSERFRKKTVDLLALIVTDGTNKFDKPISSLDEIKSRVHRMELPEKINGLAKILRDIEQTKTTYRNIRELKRKMERRFLFLAVIVGINALLPILEVPTAVIENISQMIFAGIVLIDMLAIMAIIDIYSSYRDYSQKEELFLKQLDDLEVNSGDMIDTASSFTSDNE